MKKRMFIVGGSILLVLLVLVLFVVLKMRKPEYVTLEIPMPQTFPRYAEDYAEREEFSTLVSNEGFDGQSLHYYVYRMYVPVYLGEQGFETEDDVENYYDEWLKKLGWEEEQTSNSCNSFLTEFQPVESYRAYTHPDKYAATACLVTWFKYDDGKRLDVMIKTINPSWDVLWYSD